MQQLTGLDAAFLALETRTSTGHVGGVCILDPSTASEPLDLARLTAGANWTSEDIEMSADLMVSAMLAIVLDLLEIDPRRRDQAATIERAEKQLRLIALGMAGWHSQPPSR